MMDGIEEIPTEVKSFDKSKLTIEVEAISAELTVSQALKTDEESSHADRSAQITLLRTATKMKLRSVKNEAQRLHESDWSRLVCGVRLSSQYLRQKGPVQFLLWSHVFLYLIAGIYWSMVVYYSFQEMQQRTVKIRGNRPYQRWVGSYGFLICIGIGYLFTVFYHTIALWAPYFIYTYDSKLNEEIYAVFEPLPLILLRWVGIYSFGLLTLFTMSYGDTFDPLTRFFTFLIGLSINVAMHSTLHVPWIHAGVYIPTVDNVDEFRRHNVAGVVSPKLVQKRNLIRFEWKNQVRMKEDEKDNGDWNQTWQEIRMNTADKGLYLMKNSLKLNEALTDLVYGTQLILEGRLHFGIPIFVTGLFDFTLEDIFLSRPDLEKKHVSLVMLNLLFEIPELILGVLSLNDARNISDSQYNVALLMITFTLIGLVWSLYNIYVFRHLDRSAASLVFDYLSYLFCGGSHPFEKNEDDHQCVDVDFALSPKSPLFKE